MAFEIGEVERAMSSLAIVTLGICTVIFASDFPITYKPLRQ